MAEAAKPGIDALLDAALSHVAFDGWSPATLSAAGKDLGLSEAEVRVLAPRPVLVLAVSYHRRADRAMLERQEESDLQGKRFRDRVALALRYSVEAIDDRAAVR